MSIATNRVTEAFDRLLADGGAPCDADPVAAERRLRASKERVPG
jgi:hypothetical protein